MNPNHTPNVTVDLDISNYNLEDILRLFQVPENFNEADLKRAKQQVLRIHPDKSRLEPKYFLFYSKAYKTLYSIWEFNNKKTNKTMNTEEYIPLDTSEENKRKALNSFFDNKIIFLKFYHYFHHLHQLFQNHILLIQARYLSNL